MGRGRARAGPQGSPRGPGSQMLGTLSGAERLCWTQSLLLPPQLSDNQSCEGHHTWGLLRGREDRKVEKSLEALASGWHRGKMWKGSCHRDTGCPKEQGWGTGGQRGHGALFMALKPPHWLSLRQRGSNSKEEAAVTGKGSGPGHSRWESWTAKTAQA